MTADDVLDLVALRRAHIKQRLDAETIYLAFYSEKARIASENMRKIQAELAAFDAAHPTNG